MKSAIYSVTLFIISEYNNWIVLLISTTNAVLFGRMIEHFTVDQEKDITVHFSMEKSGSIHIAYKRKRH